MQKINTRKYNPLFINGVYATIIIIIVGVLYFLLTPKYSAKVVDELRSENIQYFFKDIDNDGISEQFWYYGFQLTADYRRTTVQCRTLDNKIKGIWNHSGRYVKRSSPYFCDYNNDGITEIFTIHTQKDSILLNCIDPTRKDEFVFRNLLIDTSILVKNRVHLYLDFVDATDNNKDGYKELVFNISAGFSLTPRRLYKFDTKTQKIVRSVSTNTIIKSNPIAIDIDNDGANEYVLHMHAAANMRDTSLRFHDSNSYLMILDDDLSYFCAPYAMNAPLSYMNNYPVKIDDKIYFFSHFKANSDLFSDSLLVFSPNGKKIATEAISEKYHFDDVLTVNSPELFQEQGFQLYSQDGKIAVIDTLLNISKTKALPYKDILNIATLENDRYNDIKFIVATKDYLVFTNSSLMPRARIKNVKRRPIINVHSIQKKDTQNLLISVQSGYTTHLIEIRPNLWYQYGWIILLLLAIAVFIAANLISLISKLMSNYRTAKILSDREEHKALLARELHDELGSRITSLRLSIDKLSRSDSQQQLLELSQKLEDTHNEIKNIVHNLAPPQLNTSNFDFTLMEMGQRVTRDETNMKFEFIPDATIVNNLGNDTQKEIYRIVQEALTNIAKHANANTIIVQFMVNQRELTVLIEDDGVGFNPETVLNGRNGKGISIMQVRSELLRGQFEIASLINEGTTITLKIPYKLFYQ
ncbi:MAG: ATP-binding protein [Salinivirgaceae bacterium]